METQSTGENALKDEIEETHDGDFLSDVIEFIDQFRKLLDVCCVGFAHRFESLYVATVEDFKNLV